MDVDLVPEPLMNPREPTPLVPHKGEHTLALGHYGIGNRLGDALAMGLNCGDLRKLHHVCSQSHTHTYSHRAHPTDRHRYRYLY